MRLKPRQKKTVYIVGAGASKEVNLPTGYELRREISKCLDFSNNLQGFHHGDSTIRDAFRQILIREDAPNIDIQKYLEASLRIKNAMPQAPSIDNFIDVHSDDKEIELCGKLAIVQTILKSEKESLLYIDRSNIYNKLDFQSIEDTWYSNFMMLLSENCKKEDLKERLKSVSFIIFNYDRCIEHFLYNSLQNYYDISKEYASELVNGIEIYHPYGVVGSLPWQNHQSVDFGELPDSSKILDIASQIKTFTEGTDPDSSEITSIRKNVASADNIVFLGFAYHKLNLSLISPWTVEGGNQYAETAYFGTALGISPSDCEIIESELHDLTNSLVEKMLINNSLDCKSLFKEYWRSLSLN